MRSRSLVSIIIPCYNGGNYIFKAIRSALQQTYDNIEVIVVDDGSTDNTQEVVAQFPTVIYHYQDNSGVSKARNKGAHISTGDYVIFLDADDWLFSRAVEIHLNYFNEQPELAMVSGCHFKMISQNNEIIYKQYEVRDNNYLEMLQSNYIGALLAVMFVKKIFLQYQFNESLRYSEDYDIYLRISKNEKVFHHKEFVAAYFIHNESVSATRDLLMMESSLLVLKNIIGANPSKEEMKAYHIGVKKWKDMYINKLYWEKFRNKSQKKDFKEIKLMLMHKPHLFLRFLVYQILGR